MLIKKMFPNGGNVSINHLIINKNFKKLNFKEHIVM